MHQVGLRVGRGAPDLSRGMARVIGDQGPGHAAAVGATLDPMLGIPIHSEGAIFFFVVLSTGLMAFVLAVITGLAVVIRANWVGKRVAWVEIRRVLVATGASLAVAGVGAIVSLFPIAGDEARFAHGRALDSFFLLPPLVGLIPWVVVWWLLARSRAEN